MLRIAGVLAVVALGLSSARTKGTGEGGGGVKGGLPLRLSENKPSSLTLKSPHAAVITICLSSRAFCTLN